jgi:hypothetical protein
MDFPHTAPIAASVLGVGYIYHNIVVANLDRAKKKLLDEEKKKFETVDAEKNVAAVKKAADKKAAAIRQGAST